MEYLNITKNKESKNTLIVIERKEKRSDKNTKHLGIKRDMKTLFFQRPTSTRHNSVQCRKHETVAIILISKWSEKLAHYITSPFIIDLIQR